MRYSRVLLMAGGLVLAGIASAEMVAGPEDLSGWTVSDARFEAGGSLIRAWPNSDTTSSFYVSAPGIAGDLRDVDAIRYSVRSGGGTYYRSELGDVVIRGPAGAIRHDVTHRHDSQWEILEVALDSDGWRRDPGTPSIDAVLANVSHVLIRAEYGDGEDWSELREVHLVRTGGGGAPYEPEEPEAPLTKN